MPTLGIKKVNIIFHGLFFMTLDSVNNRLVVLAPIIPNHHLIGGVRGQRVELPGGELRLTDIGLIGKVDSNGHPAPGSPDDIEGSIMQFSRAETDVQDFGDSSKFIGSIVLPWPKQFISLRKGDIKTRFRYEPRSGIGKTVEKNAGRKNRDSVGVVVLAQYTVPALTSIDWASQLNIHFYLQPCTPHNVVDVNNDLAEAAKCFTNSTGFDLRIINDGHDPDPTPPAGDAGLGTTAEDEQSVDEERRNSPDIKLICPNPPLVPDTTPSDGSDPAVSPANCPIFFVG